MMCGRYTELRSPPRSLIRPTPVRVAEGASGGVRHLPGGAARAGGTSAWVYLLKKTPLEAQNGRGGGRGERLNSFFSPQSTCFFGSLASHKSNRQHEHAAQRPSTHPLRPRGPLCLLLLPRTVPPLSVVKGSRSRLRFRCSKHGQSCFSFEQGGGGIMSRSGVAGAAPTDLVYDGFEKAAMIEASGVLLGQISEAGAAIRSIYG